MQYLTNGDYIFPFESSLYWVKNFFIWSFQNGAVNPDGVIRFPMRILTSVIYELFGNLTFEYFYLASSLIIAFLCFWYFSKVVLHVNQKAILFLCSLLFAINPIFLGNISKVGLVLAVGVLPLCLALVYKAFNTRRVSFLLTMVVCINVALLHPYTFVLDVVAVVLYFIYLAVKKGNRDFIWSNKVRIVLVALSVPLLYAYFILPVLRIGTLSKDALSDSATAEPTDYTRLVDVANTGDIFTGFTLSKNVLKDYDFYNNAYRPVYIVSVLSLYVLIITLYVKRQKAISSYHRRIFLVSVSAALVLILLATTTFLDVDVLIKALINLPAGWIFRSPLKWQLYIPIFLCISLTIILRYIHASRRQFVATFAAISVILVAMNGYLIGDVYNKLLTPKSITTFSSLMSTDLDNKTLLYISAPDCSTYSRDNPLVASELNQVFISKNTQIKRITSSEAKDTNMSAFDYVMTCKNFVDRDLLVESYPFTAVGTFANESYELFKNKKDAAYAVSAPSVALINTEKDMAGKYSFENNVLGHNLPFMLKSEKDLNKSISIQDPFDSLTASSYKSNQIEGRFEKLDNSDKKLYVKNDTDAYYKVENGDIRFSAQPKASYQKISAKAGYQSIELGHIDKGSVIYEDASYDYRNVIPNPSFESGPWQKEVGDCYDYDAHPAIGMRIDQDSKTSGKQSLELSAKRHNACTASGSIDVDEGETYLLSIDYKSSSGRGSGYSIGYDAGPSAEEQRLISGSKEKWTTYTQAITVPRSVSTLELNLYAYPNEDGEEKSSYDNVRLVKIPQVANKFFITNDKVVDSNSPAIQTTQIDPTKKQLQFEANDTPFYLITNESFNPNWELSTTNGLHGKVGDHVSVNSNMNAWYIDPRAICQNDQVACVKMEDGRYRIYLTAEFTVQRWFYVGLGVSGLTLVGYVVYISRDIWINRKHRVAK